MFGLDSCVQAPLRGTPRFHGAHGQVRLQGCDGGVVLQLRMRGLPCGACLDSYRLWVEGGCGCPALELAGVPAWRGEAALTCYLGGFAPENLACRCVCLSMGDGCDGRIAEGILQRCCDQRPEPKRCERPRPSCAPIYPEMTPRRCACG